MSFPTLTRDGVRLVQLTLDRAVTPTSDRGALPCAHLTVLSPEGVVFAGSAGKFDVLDEAGDGKPASREDVLWFASTSKLVTAVMYLQLVDQGLLSLETDLRPLYPPLDSASARIFLGLDADTNGQPKWKENDKPVTLLSMLNHTCGFGAEFGPMVQSWKAWSEVGKGFVNSCKVENLVNTPLMFEPGTSWEYGNSYEWLALMFPTLTGGLDFETTLQSRVCKPLGLNKTSYYPFANEKMAGNLVPLRYGVGIQDSTGQVKWEKLQGQLDGLTLPRRREDIEYPAGGGGIYSCPTDYATLLSHLLTHYLSLSSSSIPAPSQPLLSDTSVKALFSPTLPRAGEEGGYPGVIENPATTFSMARGEAVPPGDVNWTAGMSLYVPAHGGRRGADEEGKGGWGRHSGSVGWGGAAGTEYFIDPVYGLAYVFTTQMLPGRGPLLGEAKKELEKCVYDNLVFA